MPLWLQRTAVSARHRRILHRTISFWPIALVTSAGQGGRCLSLGRRPDGCHACFGAWSLQRLAGKNGCNFSKFLWKIAEDDLAIWQHGDGDVQLWAGHNYSPLVLLALNSLASSTGSAPS